MLIKRDVSLLLAGALLTIGCSRTADPAVPSVSPESVAEALLAQDSTFSAAAASTDAVSGLSAMFAADVAMPAPGGKIVEGIQAATQLLQANPDHATARAAWRPIRAGISADGLHGFTFGYGTLTRPDSSRVPWKYLSYWVKGPAGWRVVVYRKRDRADSVVSMARMSPTLPKALGAPADSVAIEAYRTSLDQAERGFSDEAQRVGLGPAFLRWGRADAVNMGGPSAGFVVGAEAIAVSVSQGNPPGGSPVWWAPNRVVVAGSGDLGVSIGVIHPNQAPATGPPPGFSFFTIWYRATPTDPWRYIAE